MFYLGELRSAKLGFIQLLRQQYFVGDPFCCDGLTCNDCFCYSQGSSGSHFRLEVVLVLLSEYLIAGPEPLPNKNGKKYLQ